MIKKLYTALYADENIIYFKENFGNVVFSCNEMGILCTDLSNINLDNNFDVDNPKTFIFIFYFLNLKTLKSKISEELMQN